MGIDSDDLRLWGSRLPRMDEPDELYEFLGIDPSDPEFQRARARVEAEKAQATTQVCVHGCCVEQVMPDGRYLGGWGPAGCPCEGHHEYDREDSDASGPLPEPGALIEFDVPGEVSARLIVGGEVDGVVSLIADPEDE